jgi:phage tail sheath protein FI
MTYGRPGVYISERTLPSPNATTGTANAAGAALGVFEKGPTTPTLVTSWYDFVKKFGNYNSSYPSTFGVSQFFRNGGTELYVSRILSANAAAASIALPDTSAATIGTFTAKNKGADGNNLRVKVTLGDAGSGYYDVTVYQDAGIPDTIVSSAVTAGSEDDITLELWQNVVLEPVTSSDYISTVLNLSEYVSFTRSDDTPGVPAQTLLPLAGGTDSTLPVANDFDAALVALTLLDRPLVVFSPEAFSVFTASSNAAAISINNKLVAWADANNSFAVLDTTPALTAAGAANLTAAQALTYAQSVTKVTGSVVKSSYAAVYYPHVYVPDPVGRATSSLRKLGPASSVAGLFLSTDRQAGPFKSPAGIRASLAGVVAPEVTLSAADLDTLNAGVSPVNAIRALPGAGTVVMGARTLKQSGSAADKYVAMRRSLNYLRKRITDLTQFAVFENNNETLWTQVRTVLSVFLNEYRNQGGLRGTTPAAAYFIKCDAENNTPTDIANGIVNIEVGVALEYPAEFVVITLAQKTIN